MTRKRIVISDGMGGLIFHSMGKLGKKQTLSSSELPIRVYEG